jgi:flagellar basal body L-ring protein FlgH
MKSLSILISLIFLGSCASYIKKFHAKIAKGERDAHMRRSQKKKGYSPYSRLRKRSGRKSNFLSSNLPPKVKRKYTQKPKRTKANDLIDGGNQASIWSNFNNSTSLFTTSKRRKIGDLVVINVKENLKKDISRELKLAFPKKRAKRRPGARKGNRNTPPAQPAVANKDDNEKVDIIYDRVTSKIVEEVSENHVVVKGKKEVFFKKEKHIIEVHALMRRNDITSDDYIMSDKIIENKVVVLR